MLTLRPYSPEDAATIASWIRDEATMRRLAANLYDRFPVTADMMNKKYDSYRVSHNMVALTALDENGTLCGHFTYLFRPEEPDNARICFVITDDTRRGRGIGTGMMDLAVAYARETLLAKKITLCVFANNPAARRCYRKAGFRELEPVQQIPVMDELWDRIDMVWEGRDAKWN